MRQNNIIRQNLKYKRIDYAQIETTISEQVTLTCHSPPIMLNLIAASCIIKSSSITSRLVSQEFMLPEQSD
jgi:hypothetical protein